MPSDRPLSPHLSIYRPQISTVLSILHRITGLALFVGTALLVTWLCTAAYTPSAYAGLHAALASPVGKICLLGWTMAFYYHFANGIRHLFWDAGRGFALSTMTKTGWAVIVFTVALTACTWGFATGMIGH